MPRFAAGEYVVHPGQGVCLISGVMERPVISGAAGGAPGQGAAALVYQMSPVADARVSISYPVSKEGSLRPVMSAQEARRLVEEGPNLPSDPFDAPQSWTVRDHFTDILRRGGCREALAVAKAMHERMHAAEAQGRRPKACYVRLFNDARERMRDELACALGVSAQEAEELVCARFGVEPEPVRHA